MTTIEIVLNVKGDIELQELKFLPSMVDNTITSNQVFFPFMFVLKDKLIQKSIPETSSIQQVLTSPYLFHQLILRNTDHSQGYTRLTFAETIDRGMIEKNIKYMMNLWLSPNTTILLDKRMYTILQTQPKNTIFKSNILDGIRVVVELLVLRKDRNTSAARSKLICESKRRNIDHLYEELYGRPFFAHRATSFERKTLPVMFSNDVAETTKTNQLSLPNDPRYGPSTYPQVPRYGPSTYPQVPRYGPPTYPQVPRYGPPTYPPEPRYGPPTYPPDPRYGPPTYPPNPLYGPQTNTPIQSVSGGKTKKKKRIKKKNTRTRNVYSIFKPSLKNSSKA